MAGGTIVKLMRARAPLRLGLAGGGTDVSPYCDEYGGAILNATIGLYAYATIEPLTKPIVSFQSFDRDEQAEYESSNALPMDGKLDLLKAIHNYAVKNFNGGRPFHVKVVTRVDVPSGSGLGGSSTLVVAVLRAYSELLNMPLDDYNLAHIAYVIEREEAGLQGGRQDQFAAAFGGVNFMEFGREGHVLVNPLRIRESVLAELEASLLLYFTGASRESKSIIAEQARNVEQNNEDAIEAMHQLKKEAFLMKESLLRGDFQKLHQIMRRSWDAKKRMAQHIVNEQIETAYGTALDAGAHCAKISGAGGGGFMIFLTDPMRKERVAEALGKLDSCGTAYRCHFTTTGAMGWKADA
jgi:D-glycero-alpha-D-manno-heptose-7-phosphate kinase